MFDVPAWNRRVALHQQQTDQLRDAIGFTKSMNDCEARLDLPFGEPGLRQQGPVLGIDIVPGDPAGRRSLWFKYGARAQAAVRRSYRNCRALPVPRDVFGWGDPTRTLSISRWMTGSLIFSGVA
jgi:hypothetical protein